MNTPAIAAWLDRRLLKGSEEASMGLSEFRQICLRVALDQFENGGFILKPLPPEAFVRPERERVPTQP